MDVVKTEYRVLYADTDKMGVVYNANYIRWFEMGRNELFRKLGIPYKEIEQEGFYLPVCKVLCKFLAPARYDDIVIIKTEIDKKVKAAVKFDYVISSADEKIIHVKGYTKHAFVDKNGRLCRPPDFLKKYFGDELSAF